MILYTAIPSTVNNLIDRLKSEAVADSQTDLVNLLTSIGTVSWYNLPYNLNKLVLALKGYQAILFDGDLQDLIDDLDTIYWFDLFRKVSLLIEATELIESLT
jgi:hypothetical protein